MAFSLNQQSPQETGQHTSRVALKVTPPALFHHLTVSAVERVAADAVELTLAVPEGLREEFGFEAGQHLTVLGEAGHGSIRRSYSMTGRANAAPGQITIGVRIVPGGELSPTLGEAQPGTVLTVMQPAGRFGHSVTTIPSASHTLCISAGSGITPILSVLRSLFEQDPRATATLIFGNRTTQSTMFLEQLDDLKNRYTSRFDTLVLLSREDRESPLLCGRITSERIRELWRFITAGGTPSNVFICGPDEMSAQIALDIADLGVDADHIHVERFTIEGQTRRVSHAAGRDTLGVGGSEPVSTATLILRGISSSISIRQDETVLDAALREGIDAPYSCTGGVCATCRAHISGGSVSMMANQALDQREVEQGFALTCQSIPKSGTLVVDFDRT